MTSAINGKIIFKQADRATLENNKRSNSLVFDLTNSRILYSPSGTNYFEFGSIDYLSSNLPYLQTSSTQYYYLSGVSGDIQGQINYLSAYVKTISGTSGGGSSGTTYVFGAYLPLSGGTISGTVYGSNISANNISAINFLGLTSAQIPNLPYLQTSSIIYSRISAISGDVQSQINYLSANIISDNDFWLSLSGGNVSGNISANSFVKNGGTSGQFLKADGSTDSNQYALNSSTVNTSSLTSPAQNQLNGLSGNFVNYYPISSTGNISGLSGSAQAQINFLSAFIKTISGTSSSSISGAYLPISGGSLTGPLNGTNISANNISALNFVGLTSGQIPNLSYLQTSSTLYSYLTTISGNVQNQINYLSAYVKTISGTSGSSSTNGAYLPLSGGSVSGNISANNISAVNIFGNIYGDTLQNIIYQTLILTSSVSSTPSATSANLKTFKYNLIPNMIGFLVSGAGSGDYSATYNIYSNYNNSLLKVAYGYITSANNLDSNMILNAYSYNSFAGDITVSGTSPSPILLMVKS